MASASLSNYFLIRFICIISAAMMAYLSILLRQDQYSQGSIRYLELYDHSLFCLKLIEYFLKVRCLIWTMYLCLPTVFYMSLSNLYLHRAKEYNVSGMIQLIKAWKDVFCRTNVIVFPNYILPVFTSDLIVISTIIESLSYGWRSSDQTL